MTPYRILRETNSAVNCSTIREFSNDPASNARTPGIALAKSITVFFASASPPQTSTSQSTSRERSFSISALTLLNADTSLTSFGKSLDASAPADPSHTSTVRVADPPTAVSKGTVTLTTI
ncbi:hypothetical protein E6H22_03730, partial [Candidatus Bathyarchaeota archaeon]